MPIIPIAARWSAVFCLVCLLWSHACGAGAKPNIVLIISDDQSWTDYGFMSHPQIRTPALDKLAGQSAAFSRGYVPTALCRPALMSLVSGRYSHQSHSTGNDPAATPANALHASKSGKTARELLISHIDQAPTLPKLLAAQGYLSFQCGKWWEGSYQRGGFTHGMTQGYPKPGGRHGDAGLTIGRQGLQPVFDFIAMAQDKKQPFFLWYAPIMPHTPHTPPERILQHYLDQGLSASLAKYDAMCEWFDETCGQLLAHLDEKGLSDDTLVVYVTDNGWIQLPNGAGYAPRSKRSAYEGGTRTPILFRWPGVIPPANRPELCSSIDLVPTMLGAAGAEIPANLDGLNLLPSLRDGKPLTRNAIFGEAFAHDIADIEKPEASLLHRWIIEGPWKLLLTYDGAQGRMQYPPTAFGPQLYDLLKDPHEKNNLANEQPELVARLAKRIDDWWPLTERKQAPPK